MAKVTNLSEYEKGEITVLKKSRKISGRSKNVICNYLKSPNKYVTEKPTGRPEKLSPLFKKGIVREVRKKTSSTSIILKSLVDAPCSTCIIRRHLNNEKLSLRKVLIVLGKL